MIPAITAAAGGLARAGAATMGGARLGNFMTGVAGGVSDREHMLLRALAPSDAAIDNVDSLSKATPNASSIEQPRS